MAAPSMFSHIATNLFESSPALCLVPVQVDTVANVPRRVRKPQVLAAAIISRLASLSAGSSLKYI